MVLANCSKGRPAATWVGYVGNKSVLRIPHLQILMLVGVRDEDNSDEEWGSTSSKLTQFHSLCFIIRFFIFRRPEEQASTAFVVIYGRCTLRMCERVTCQMGCFGGATTTTGIIFMCQDQEVRQRVVEWGLAVGGWIVGWVGVLTALKTYSKYFAD